MNEIANIKFLIVEGTLNGNQLRHLEMAYDEHSSSAMNWLTSALRLMKERLRSNASITISSDDKTIVMKTPEQLVQWIIERFPEARRDLQ
ncbi:hypothetical protein [Hydrogenophaga sp.]|uniref:hypothetical protein n=1 Tax=Hydrogenophaga sp. TaxID=1904254 RepID=UPI002FC7C94F